MKHRILKDIASDIVAFVQSQTACHQSAVAEGDFRSLRSLFFRSFATPEFRSRLRHLSRLICEELQLDMAQYRFQAVPTPRIFLPGHIGTSIHCDYWYGHGSETKTVWIPLSELDEENTMIFDFDDRYDESEGTLAALDAGKELEVAAQLKPVLIDKGDCFIFDSTAIHGSPLNRSRNPRLSFDYRLASIGDTSSTKDINEYLGFGEEQAVSPCQEQNYRFLKYICGGRNISTRSQHIIIEGVADANQFNVVAQEAEIERFGIRILRSYGLNDKGHGRIDAIIVASRSLFDEQELQDVMSFELPVFDALANKFLNVAA